MAAGLLLIGLVLGVGQFFVVRTERDIAEYQRCMNAERSLLQSAEQDCARGAETTWYGAPFTSTGRISKDTITDALVFILPPSLLLFVIMRTKSKPWKS